MGNRGWHQQREPRSLQQSQAPWRAFRHMLLRCRNLNLNLNLLIYYSPILTRSFGGALHWLLVLANLLSLTSFWGGAISSHLNSLGSIQGCYLMQCTHLVKPLTIITCLSLIFGRVRSPVVGHESDGPQVVFNVHQSHRHDSTDPSLFYLVGYHLYICGVQHSSAQSHITLWSNAGRTVTHPCINRARDCLTSVIKHKTFAPCYVSPHIILYY